MPRTVLLADDSVTAQNMGRRILTDAGYEVITVNNGSAALKKIHETRPDLIVLDVYMPGYGGLEVCQRLKESGDTMRIPVLLSVGKMEPFKADEAKRVRADAHIVKPFEASELLAALAKLEDRIVPHADGRKSKKPSFWHGEDEATGQSDWTDNAAYLAQVKQRKGSSPEVVESAPISPSDPGPTKVAAASPLPEPTEELPVIADPSGIAMESESNAGQPIAAGATAGEETTEAPKSREAEPCIAAVEGETSSEAIGSERLSAVVSKELIAEASQGSFNASADNSLASQPQELSADDSHPIEGSAPSAPTVTPAATKSGGHWIAENVALTPEEAALELDQEMRAAEVVESAPAGNALATPEMIAPEETQGAAFAAAAGASSIAVATPSGNANDETETPGGSQAAAAWENWQQIRESVMSGKNTEAIAQTVAQAAKAMAPGEMPEAIAATESSSSSDIEPGALASIVDSVLAELKPKLMEEIAKKLKK